jgi:DNA-binding winged helix-turn-helix (wHTH) protein/tetratricopeptide (TPR) repeat protein
VLRFAGFELDQRRAELRGPDGNAIKLRPRSFEMLKLFAANAGRILTKQELMDAVWQDVHVGEDSLFQSIRELRTALGDDQRQTIRLMSGRGYLFVADVTDAAAPDTPEQGAIGQPAPAASNAGVPAETGSQPAGRRLDFKLRSRAAFAVAAGLAILAIAGAAATMRPGAIFAHGPAAITVMPIMDTSGDPLSAQMAADVSDRLADGLAKIANIRVLIPQPAGETAREAAKADFVVRGELQKGEQAWTIRARMTATDTGEVKWTNSYSVNLTDSADLQLQQSRLAAGVGHALALRINEIINADMRSPAASGRAPTDNSKVVIEQATAYINQNTPERFRAAQAMLEKALADDADNIDLQLALAGQLMRGIQMVWVSAAERDAAETQTEAMLQQTLKARPTYIPALETYCRFLNTTNQFRASLVTCAKALTFDPWDGIALFHIGVGQIQTGRFEEALATFKQADRFDTPQVSRWTWMIGAGWANMLMGRPEDAVPWLLKSIAITSASGRTHMLLAAAYQQLGRPDEAKAAMAKGLQLRPGSTLLNVPPPTKNSSPVYLEAAQRILQSMVAAGLPQG